MLALLGPRTYQLFHWWHWLTYGTGYPNAVALQAAVAVAAFIGLALYTLYTRRMRDLQAESSRLTLFPTLSLENFEENLRNWAIQLRNVGAGAALNMELWCQPVSERFSLRGNHTLSRSEKTVATLAGSLLHSESKIIQIPKLAGSRWVFVVDMMNVHGARHQLQILRTAFETTATIEIQMVNPWDHLPRWKRLAIGTRGNHGR